MKINQDLRQRKPEERGTGAQILELARRIVSGEIDENNLTDDDRRQISAILTPDNLTVAFWEMSSISETKRLMDIFEKATDTDRGLAEQSTIIGMARTAFGKRMSELGGSIR